MSPKPKFTPSGRSIPSEAYGRRTAAQIAKEYGQQAEQDAIGKPLPGSNPATAEQINTTYQNGLNNALVNAIQNWTQSMNKHGNENKAWNDTYTKLQEDLATKPDMPQPVKTAIKDAVRDIFRETLRIPPPKIPLHAPPTELEIKKVVGMPKNPGVISWEDGAVKVEIFPPYRKGSADIGYQSLPEPTKGEGTQERTLAVKGGEAPRLLQLGRGWDDIGIHRGRRMTHRKQRDYGLVIEGNRAIRQPRGTIVD
jgi:hypothetical protein